jgi:two-component system, NtrC family, nitrogen regulation sensor histidine kinase NtrY
MGISRYRKILATSTVLLFLLALAAESLFFSDFEYRFRTRMFKRVLHGKENTMEECLTAMKPVLASENHHGSVSETNVFAVAAENEITILEYLDNKLHYWSDNGFDVPKVPPDSLFKKKLVFLQNGWFIPMTVQAGNEKIVGLLRLRTEYSFENDIIKSGFEKDFGLSGNVGFTTDRTKSHFDILNRDGEYLFSLSFPEVRENTWFILIPLFLWATLFVVLILLSIELTRTLSRGGWNMAASGLLLLAFSFIYSLVLITGSPSILFKTELFMPYRFSLNWFIPSPGHLVILSILAASFAVNFQKYYPSLEREPKKGIRDFLLLTGLLTCGAALFLLVNYIFSQLILNSNVNFESYKATDLNGFSAVAFASVLLFFLVPVLFTYKIFTIVKSFSARTIAPAIFASLVLPVIAMGTHFEGMIPFAAFYILITSALCIAARRRSGTFSTSSVFSLLIAFYSLYVITTLSDARSAENMKIEAVSLSSENDPDAEHLLLDIWPVLEKDSTLVNMMQVQNFDTSGVDMISSYLHETYFTGYWRNFNFSIVVCRNDEQLRIGSGNEVAEDCFSFFGERIRRDGHQLTGTDFYFMENQGGRSYYVGKLLYKTSPKTTNGLFIELYSDVNVFQPGYSELLLDRKYHGYAGLKDYSFAKYINGKIVLRTGDFPYDKSDAGYIEENMEFSFFENDGYRHVLYKNGNATVLISRPRLTVGDMVISIAYLFAFILLFYNLILVMVRPPDFKALLTFNFRQKLQMAFIGILLFSFMLTGILVASFTVKQFRTRHSDNLKEKLNSVYLELDERISGEKRLTSGWSNISYSSLNDLLINLSNVFMTDINIYDLQGFLIATSRPELFNRDLTSHRISDPAYNNLAHFTRSEYIQMEKIGSLEYLSAYVPFFNADNQKVAYLNLPYFRMQSVLAKEISNLAVAVINFTLLLIVITMSIAVFISGRLTTPLRMLGEGLASVGIGRKSEHLSYKGKDEIGELVKQYNVMVDEIEVSAQKLANSEREYAWREMAKQIAHEIKNPLTPMKLNVQQLFKSWNDKAPGFDKTLERFTMNQIEYIDNLSSIATAFSSFAKMPATNPGEINLLDHIKLSLELFKNTDNVTFNVKWPAESKVIIFSDKEQLNGIFSNLIKNGIQSIPPGREGIIQIGIDILPDKVVVSVSDNGTGIPGDLQKKLFTPNFTTKSSGMGLGLSIVKKYVESSNGRIWFKSETDKGSVFCVELPLMYTVDEHG